MTSDVTGGTNPVPTGCESLDTLLSGGFTHGQTAQVYGEPSAGKTNIIASTAAYAAMAGEFVGLISRDPTTFDRTTEIVDHAAENPAKVLQNIQMKRAESFDEQAYAINQIRDKKSLFSVILFDGIGANYRNQRSQDDTNSRKVERVFTRQGSILKAIARRENVAVVTTNQVYYNPDEDDINVLGGTTLRNWFDSVLRVESFTNGKRCLTVEKDRETPQNEKGWFTIRNEGLHRVE